MTHPRRTAAAILLALSALCAAAAPTTDPARLAADLAHPDPATRAAAAQSLLALDRAARPALIVAMNGDQPQARATAAELILKLPFDQPGDPSAFVGMLARYGQATPPNRANYLRTIANLATGNLTDGPRILLRLMNEEPSDELRWVIVGHFRHSVDRKNCPPAAAFDPIGVGDRGPNLALAGWIREAADPPAALRWYRRCVDAELRRPTLDSAGDADFVFSALLSASISAGDYEAAAATLRAKYVRRPWPLPMRSAERFNALDEVFALHADFGPLKHFAADVSDFRDELARPQIVYALGRAYDRRAAQPLVADALCRVAYAIGMGSPVTRDASGEFLASRNWEPLARQEFEAVLAAADDNGLYRPYAANAHLRLGYLAGRRGDDAGAAEHLRLGMESLKSMGHTVTHTRGDRRVSGKEAEDRVWAEIHWRTFRAARDKDDVAAMNKAVETLATFEIDDDVIAADLVPAFQDRGLIAQANRVFTRAYDDLTKQLEDRPADPYRMNKLAWLCATSKRHLDQAQTLIDAALKSQPDNSSFLDTAAEVAFQRGDYARAVALEERALAQKPDESFLQRQLARFRAAKKVNRG
jgi:tetratricopeptide (TPR) repeat protein